MVTLVFATLVCIALGDINGLPGRVALSLKPKALTAEETIACGMQYADIDKDGRISLREVEVIRDLALGRVLAAGYWLASRVPLLDEMITTKQIFVDCDFDKDNYITMADFAKMRATCLNTPKKINDADVWICQQGPKGVFAHAKL